MKASDKAKIDKLLDDLNNVYYSDIEKSYLIASEILELATKNNQYPAICKAYTTMSQYAYFNSDMKQAWDYANKAMKVAEEHSCSESFALSHSLCALIYTKQNDECSAITHFHKAIQILKDVNNYRQLISLYSNMGAMYYNLEDFDRVLYCFETSQYYLTLENNMNPNPAMFNYHTLLLNINKSLIYVKQNRPDKIKELLPYIESARTTNYFNSLIQTINVLYTKYYYITGDINLFYEWVEIVLRTAPLISYGTDVLCDYFDIYDYLIEQKSYEQAEILLEIIKTTAVETQSDDIIASSYRRQFWLYRKLKYTDKVESLLPSYYQALQKLNNEMDNLQTYRMKSYITVEQEIRTREHYQEELITLEHQSSYDALTGLANRSFLNIYTDSAFENCLEKKINYGVIIIDIDHFKKYNDSYGHLAGDYCIMQVASVIKKCIKSFFCARFGGDEFFVITTGIDSMAVQKLCQDIQDNLSELVNKEIGNSFYRKVSVSFGFYIAIPEKGQLPNDFTHFADTALYKAKFEGRNRINEYSEI